MVHSSAGGNRRIPLIGVVFLGPVDFNAMNGHIVHIDIEFLCNQFLHGLDAIDVELGVVEFHRKGGGGQQCQHHGEDQEC